MSFASWQYLFFLACVVAVYWQLNLPGRWRLLWISSYIFYASWDPRFVALLLASTVVDYVCGRGIAGEARDTRRVAMAATLPLLWCLGLRVLNLFLAALGLTTTMPEVSAAAFGSAAAFALVFPMVHGVLCIRRIGLASRSKQFLGLSIASNLGVLIFFKYCGFFVESFAGFARAVGWEVNPGSLEILLPIAISFYTFQSIGYAVDIYKGRTEPCRDVSQFAAYLAFFPQLAAGPIERAKYFLPQFETARQWSAEYIHQGCRLLLVGLFKKVFVADHCAPLARHVFDSGAPLDGPWAMLGVLAFAFQIYGDFSGYTDMARGSARLMGFELSSNFRFPYLARSPSDFWQRWHITLSSWFRDYVYIPLGGNRLGAGRTVVNLWLTMLLAGLWHGASWMFVIWGGYHALLLTLYQRVGFLKRADDPEVELGMLQTFLYRSLCFAFTLVGWAIFRSPTPERMWEWLAAWSHGWGDGLVAILPSFAWWMLHVIPLILWQAGCRKSEDEASTTAWPWAVRGMAYLLAIVAVATSVAQDQEFLYFQF